ncbi:MAG: peptidoglycan-associated lipoprotein Pal [Gemmatimonadaceae bacterium]
MSSRAALLVAASLALVLVACHSAKPTVAPMVAHAANTDSIDVAERARRAAAARLDSVARANAAGEDAARREREAVDAMRVTLTSAIHFDYDRDELLAAAVKTLDAKVTVLRANPSVHLRVEGNTDERGSDEYNLALGQRRAVAAKRYLVDHGVEDKRLEVASYGEERPLCREASDSCWSQNRRDDFSILSGLSTIAAMMR